MILADRGVGWHKTNRLIVQWKGEMFRKALFLTYIIVPQK